MAKLTTIFSNILNNKNYYARIYPINYKGYAQSELDGQITINAIIPASFPAEPSNYSLIDTYTSSTTFTAPEDGWYQVELFGRSGKGGSGKYVVYSYDNLDNPIRLGAAGGGGGGGGAYCCSRVKLNKDNIVNIVIGTTCTVTINSTTDESYSVMKCTTGTDGGTGSAGLTSDNYKTATGGSGGSGGSASGGNYANLNGKSGSKGNANAQLDIASFTGTSTVTLVAGGSGGAACISGANTGGVGASPKAKFNDESTMNYYSNLSNGSAGSAKSGFCKIYRGNTNVTSGGNDSSSVPSAVTNFALSGNEFNVALSWTNPTADSYYKTIIVQKVGSAPTNLTDGTQVYNGTGTSYNVVNLSPSTTYYYAAFSIDNNSNYAEDFPVKNYTTPAYATLTSADTGTFSLTGGSVWSNSNLAISGMKFYTSSSIYGNNGQMRSAYAASANAIDVTNYSKLQFKTTSSVTIDYDYSGDNYEHTAYCYLYFGICDSSNKSTSTFTKKVAVNSSGTYELDVSGLSGNYYLKFMFQSRDNEDGGADIDYSCTISDIKLYP